MRNKLIILILVIAAIFAGIQVYAFVATDPLDELTPISLEMYDERDDEVSLFDLHVDAVVGQDNKIKITNDAPTITSKMRFDFLDKLTVILLTANNTQIINTK